jgi:hypothetical protein
MRDRTPYPGPRASERHDGTFSRSNFRWTSGEAAQRIAVNFANLPRLLAQSPMDECPFQ